MEFADQAQPQIMGLVANTARAFVTLVVGVLAWSFTIAMGSAVERYRKTGKVEQTDPFISMMSFFLFIVFFLISARII